MNSSMLPIAYDLNDFAEFVDLNRFQYCFVSYSGGVLAIATDTSLILTDDVSNAYKADDLDTTRLVLEFNEDSGRATCIQWIIEGAVVSVGFESGLVVCFNCKGEEIFEFKGANTCVQAIKVASTEIHKKEAAIWILYEEGYLVSFPVSHLDGESQRNSSPLCSYRLSNHKLVNDFVFYPAVYKSSIFDIDDPTIATQSGVGTNFGTIHHAGSGVNSAVNSPMSSKKSHKRSNSNINITKDVLSIFTAGKESPLAVYNLGNIIYNETNSNGVSVRESAVNLLSKGVMSLYNSLYGTDTNTTERKLDTTRVQETLLTVAARIEFKDIKRRVLRLSADPTSTYIVCSDILGRVTLFDTTVSAIVRIWKGLRHAELAWTTRVDTVPSTNGLSGVYTSNSSVSSKPDYTDTYTTSTTNPPYTTSTPNASLVIHAPLLGLVYIYRVPHGECIRIVPVGLNCHILSLSTPPYSGGRGYVDDNRSEHSVRAYLLKPHVDKGTLELSEIRPADRTDADLDVRLTLVGEDDYTIGDFNDEDEDEDLQFDTDGLGSSGTTNAAGNNSGVKDSSGSANIGVDGITHLELPTRYSNITSTTTNATNGASANTSATEVYAMRNIEQALQILVEVMPMHALYTHLHSTNTATTANNTTNTTNTTTNTVYPPLHKDAFDVEVHRAEEAVLETLNAHKAVLTPHSLYKCMCMIECVELYGTLHTPSYATNTNNTTNSDASSTNNISALLHTLQTINTTTNTTSTTTTSNTNNTLLKQAIQSEHSSISLQSLMSENSHSSKLHTLHTLENDTDTIQAKKAALLRLTSGLLRYPVFSPHLHKTLLTLLDTAVKNNTNKHQYDVHTGTLTTLPTHVLEYVQTELPVRMQLLSAYTTLCEISSTTDRVNNESMRNNTGFSALHSLNMRTMLDRSVSSIVTSPYPFNTTIPYGTTSTSTTIPHKLIEEIHTLCKSSSVRSEAAMWTLRAAQNAELHTINTTVHSNIGATTESGSGKHDRNASADSTSSYRSIQNSIYTTRLSSGTSTDILAAVGIDGNSSTNTTNAANTTSANTNSHSKVKRVGNSTTPPKSPLRSQENSNNNSYNTSTNTANYTTLHSAYTSPEPKRLVRMSSRGSVTHNDISGEGAEYEYTLSFSVFRAFISVHSTSTNTANCELYTYYNATTTPVLRTTQLLHSIHQAEHIHYGTLHTLFDTICSVYHITTHTSNTTNTNTTSTTKIRTGSPGNSSIASSGHSTPRNPHNTSMHSMYSTHTAEDADTNTAVALLQALTLSANSVETLKPNTTKPTNTASTVYSPTIQIPHTLLHTLVTPLLGDIFSLTNYTATLNTLGMHGKLTPLMHVSPLFAAYLSHQSSVHLLTEVLTKKLSVFPYQRWLRDTLLSFQDTLTVLVNTTAASGSVDSVDSTGVSRSSSAVHSSDVPYRHNVTASAERDARDVYNTVYSSTSNMYNTTTPSSPTTSYTSSVYNPATNTHTEHTTNLDASDDTQAIYALANDIREVYRRDVLGSSTNSDISSGVSTLRLNSVEQGLPSYNEFIRHILRPAWLYCTTCPHLEAVLVYSSIVLEVLYIVNEQVERRTYGAMSLNSVSSVGGGSSGGRISTITGTANATNITVSTTATGASSNSVANLHTMHTSTISIWENLVRQTRVALLLQSRSGGSMGTATHNATTIPTSTPTTTITNTSATPTPLTLHTLSTTTLSTHRLLAHDTLAFALRAEQALEHEDKCREVYARSVGASGGTVGGSGNSASVGSVGGVAKQQGPKSPTNSKAEVLLAYGPSADRRWRDLLNVALAEDAIHAANMEEKRVAAAIAAGSGTTNGIAVDHSGTSASNPSSGGAVAVSEEQKRSLRKRRPLLLYFPLHSQPHILGAYRSIILAERWSRALHRVDLLVSCLQHLYTLPHTSFRPAVAHHLYYTVVLPVVQLYVLLEQDSGLCAYVSSGGSVESYVGSPSDHNSTSGSGKNGYTTKLTPKQVPHLLRLVSDNRLLKAFVNAAAELLGYIELALQTVHTQPSKPTTHKPTTTTTTTTPHNATNTTTSTTTNTHPLWLQPDVQHALHHYTTHTHTSAYVNEHNALTWPGTEDVYVNTLLLQFVELAAGKYALSTSTTTTAPTPLYTLLSLSEHISRLWTLHLRSLCGLKGIKPSTILGAEVIKTMQAFGEKCEVSASSMDQASPFTTATTTTATTTATTTTATTSTSCHFSVSNSVRSEFLAQCLRQLVYTKQPTGAVYVLVMRWLSMQSTISTDMGTSGGSSSTAIADGTALSMDSVRLLHLNTLLAAGGGSRDEEAEQMVHQISQTEVVLDTLIQALRTRLGGILSAIDTLPQFGPLIASMDAEAVAWARTSVPNNSNSYSSGSSNSSGTSNSGSSGIISGGGNGAVNAMGGSAGVSAGDVEGSGADTADGSRSLATELSLICKNLNINIASTRHLIICVQSNLLNVPLNMRSTTTNISTSSDNKSSIGGASASTSASSGVSSSKVTWFERKTRCDALLTLCKYFAQQIATAKN